MRKPIPTITLKLPLAAIKFIEKKAKEQNESENKVLNLIIKNFFINNKTHEIFQAEKFFRTLTGLSEVKSIKPTRDNYNLISKYYEAYCWPPEHRKSKGSLVKAAIMQEIIPKGVQKLIQTRDTRNAKDYER
tara:strand:+ start:377 stop:772 length:396 start_codon:yes stop_codon:yes gene_type:complete